MPLAHVSVNENRSLCKRYDNFAIDKCVYINAMPRAQSVSVYRATVTVGRPAGWSTPIPRIDAAAIVAYPSVCSRTYDEMLTDAMLSAPKPIFFSFPIDFRVVL